MSQISLSGLWRQICSALLQCSTVLCCSAVQYSAVWSADQKQCNWQPFLHCDLKMILFFFLQKFTGQNYIQVLHDIEWCKLTVKVGFAQPGTNSQVRSFVEKLVLCLPLKCRHFSISLFVNSHQNPNAAILGLKWGKTVEMGQNRWFLRPLFYPGYK